MKDDKNIDANLRDLSSTLDSPVFPEWMSVVMKIESVYRLSVNNAQRLYHYTSLEGFQSIMQKRDFWISNIRYMNDSHEFENGKAICKGVIEEELGRNEKDEIDQYLQGLLNVCNQKTSQGFHVINSKNIFSLSFCNNGDVLTQWQFYGNEGVAIGFENAVSSFDAITFMNEDQYDEEIEEVNPDEMLPHDEIRLFPKRIIYKDDEKIEIFESIIKIGINFIKNIQML